MRHDFSKTLFHPSSLGLLFTKSRDKKEMGETAKKELRRIYAEEKYGKKVQRKGKSLKKGTLGEESALELLSIHLDVPLVKNKERIENEYLTGEVDAFVGNTLRTCTEIFDTKCSETMDSFLDNVDADLKAYCELQNHGYMSLLPTAKKATTSFCLVNMPETMINDEKLRLFYKMNAITEESPEYKEAAANLEFNLVFDDIDPAERVLLFPTHRDENKIIEIYNACIGWREWLQEFQERHIHFNKKHL